ncbi:MAG: AN1-type zinc finger domain-containing protein [Candidatus Hodarchaeales archaeon]
MELLTSRERSSLVLAIGLILSLVLTRFLFSGENHSVLHILWGVIAMIFSVIVAYTFVFQTKYFYGRTDPYSYSSKTDSFSPKISPPSKLKKKTQIEGRCNQCGVSALLGFTCSYCGEYYCADHRLPEKHNCFGRYNT